MRYFAFAVAGILAANACLADTVTTRDGVVREGTVTEEDEDTVTFQVRRGEMKASVTIARRDIISLTRAPLPEDPVATEGAALKQIAEAQTDPAKAVKAWLLVAEFYEGHPGYSVHAKTSFEKVLLFDADNAAARAKLGYTKTDKGWQKAEPKKPEVPEEIVIGPKPVALQPVQPAQPVNQNPPPPPPPPPLPPPPPPDEEEEVTGERGAVYLGRDRTVYCPPGGTMIIEKNGVRVIPPPENEANGDRAVILGPHGTTERHADPVVERRRDDDGASSDQDRIHRPGRR